MPPWVSWRRGAALLLKNAAPRLAAPGGILFSSQALKPNGKRAFLVDTLALVSRLEACGVESKHAEAIIEALNESLENVSQTFVSKEDMQKSEMLQDFNLSRFKSQIQSFQEHSLLKRETEKLSVDIEKMRAELRLEIQKFNHEQHQYLNLQTKRIRDETTELTSKLDQEIHELQAQLGATKYDVLKYSIGTLVSLLLLWQLSML
ncbi:hypothetical protein J5N97_002896 [Dioscorea zingiberensis]|uniref:Uncharacterized protein n=1 Tax=Dioscorea zingiberensis TaxID=325984 RepID=A0A9D5HPK2_9LILI|nr:hypothetical protein J5N97_002896 [Dioscorea zingiberensis]